MHSLVRATNQVSGRLSGRQRFLPSVLFLPPIVPLVSRHGKAVCFYGVRCTWQKSARSHYISRATRREMHLVSTFHFSERPNETCISAATVGAQRFSISFASNLVCEAISFSVWTLPSALFNNYVSARGVRLSLALKYLLRLFHSSSSFNPYSFNYVEKEKEISLLGKDK